MQNSNGHQVLQRNADSTYVPCVFRWDTVHPEPTSFLGNSRACFLSRITCLVGTSLHVPGHLVAAAICSQSNARFGKDRHPSPIQNYQKLYKFLKLCCSLGLGNYWIMPRMYMNGNESSKFSVMSFLHQVDRCGQADLDLQLASERKFEWCHPYTQMPPGATTTGWSWSGLHKPLQCLAGTFALRGALWTQH